MDAWQIRQGHWLPVFLPWGGRLPVTNYLCGLWFLVFPCEPQSLRVFALLMGGVTFLFMIVLSKNLFGRDISLATAFLLSVGWWPVFLQRTGEFAWANFFWVTLALYFLWKSFQKPGWLHFILLGLGMGLGCYNYSAFWVFPVFVFLFAVGSLFYDRTWAGQHWPKIIAAFVLMAILLVPLILYAINNQGYFFYRLRDVGLFNQPQWGRLLGQNLFKLFANLWPRGDQAAYFDEATAVLFLLGIIFCFIKIREFKYAVLLLGLVCFSLPGLLSSDASEFVGRMNGSLPFLFMLAGLGLIYVMDRAGKARVLLGLGLVVFMAVSNMSILQNEFFKSTHLSEYEAGKMAGGLLDRGRAVYFAGFEPFSSVPVEFIAEDWRREFQTQKPNILLFNLNIPSRTEVLRRKIKGVEFCSFPNNSGSSPIVIGMIPLHGGRSLVQDTLAIKEADAQLRCFQTQGATEKYLRLAEVVPDPFLKACLWERLGLTAKAHRNHALSLVYFEKLLGTGFDFPEVKRETGKLIAERDNIMELMKKKYGAPKL